MNITWELFTFFIGMTVSVSTIISKLFMRYLESQIKNLNDVINERKEDCVGLSERIEEVEKYHIETRVSLAKIGKDIEYIKQENNKMSLNIEKILNHKIK